MKKDVELQDKVLSILYDFADCQHDKKGEFHEHSPIIDGKIGDGKPIYSVGEYFEKIMAEFGYEVVPID